MDARAIRALIESTMSALARRRPLFHREADLQHELAWQLQLDNPDARLRLELRPFPDQGVFLDLLSRLGGTRLAVEVKYPTAALTVTIDDEVFRLREHSADDVVRYDILKDIARL